MKAPLLSVIIPNHNGENYIGECLNSILVQSFKDLEIIVYDDYSNDNSRKILEKYEKNSPNIIKLRTGSKNLGVARARHEAILCAQGEYLTTLDSDDYYLDPQKLEKEMELMLKFQGQNKEIIAFSNIILVDKDSNKIGPQWPAEKIKEGNLFEKIFSRTCMIPRDFIMKKSVYFEAGGYSPNLKTHEDWDLKIRIARNHEFYYTGINGCAYRIHNKGLSSRPHRGRTSNLYRVFYNYFPTIPKNRKKKIIGEFTKFMRSRQIQSRQKICGVIMDQIIKWYWKFFYMVYTSQKETSHKTE